MREVSGMTDKQKATSQQTIEAVSTLCLFLNTYIIPYELKGFLIDFATQIIETASKEKVESLPEVKAYETKKPEIEKTFFYARGQWWERKENGEIVFAPNRCCKCSKTTDSQNDRFCDDCHGQEPFTLSIAHLFLLCQLGILLGYGYIEFTK